LISNIHDEETVRAEKEFEDSNEKLLNVSLMLAYVSYDHTITNRNDSKVHFNNYNTNRHKPGNQLSARNDFYQQPRRNRSTSRSQTRNRSKMRNRSNMRNRSRSFRNEFSLMTDKNSNRVLIIIRIITTTIANVITIVHLLTKIIVFIIRDVSIPTIMNIVILVIINDRAIRTIKTTLT
jgi:hypothetical protein